MDLVVMQGCCDELQKLAQEGVVRRTARRARVAGEFAQPPAEAGVAALLLRGLGVRDPRKLLTGAGVGVLHGIYKKTRQYAG